MQKITPHLWFDKEARAFLPMKKFDIAALKRAYQEK
jgi:predicted 3-demethylubiquinone-9 3-methyltransferase (glyoxalase superfamily)